MRIFEPGVRVGVRRARIALVAMVLALSAAAVGADAAHARGLTTGFTDDLFISPNPGERGRWLDRAVDARAGIIRISVNWRESVGSNPPANPTNPADPAYNFGQLDGGVRSARDRGLDVMLTVYRAPSWAEGANPRRGVDPGTWKPDPTKLKQFGTALARRYSGDYQGLPRVKYFEAWTEPNLKEYLAPQWKKHKAKSPGLYRRMLNAFYRGVKAGQRSAKVIGGATAPYGDAAGGVRMRPITFLRDLFCLDRHFKPNKCPSKPHLDILSHHPINFFTNPHHKAFSRNDAPTANFSRVKHVMRAAAKTKHVRPKGRKPLWATEILWYTDPPTRFGVPVNKEARWLEDGLYLLWKQGASVVINFEIRDLPYDPKHPRLPYSGVFFENGDAKPAYRAWRFPFVTHRKSKKRILAWGKAPQSGKLKIQRKKGHGHWRNVKKLNVRKGKVFKRPVRLKGKAKLRAKLGNTTSLTWRQRK
jgi:hypothetical protein